MGVSIADLTQSEPLLKVALTVPSTENNPPTDPLVPISNGVSLAATQAQALAVVANPSQGAAAESIALVTGAEALKALTSKKLIEQCLKRGNAYGGNKQQVWTRLEKYDQNPSAYRGRTRPVTTPQPSVNAPNVQAPVAPTPVQGGLPASAPWVSLSVDQAKNLRLTRPQCTSPVQKGGPNAISAISPRHISGNTRCTVLWVSPLALGKYHPQLSSAASQFRASVGSSGTPRPQPLIAPKDTKVFRLTEKTVREHSFRFTNSAVHAMCDVGNRVPCQWCYFQLSVQKGTAGNKRKRSQAGGCRTAGRARDAANVRIGTDVPYATVMCRTCAIKLCGAKCWNDWHGVK